MASSPSASGAAGALENMVRDSLDYAGRILACAADDASQAQASSSARDMDMDSSSPQSGRYTSTDAVMWKVVVLPVARGRSLDKDSESALEEACMRALASLSKDSEDLGSSSAGGNRPGTATSSTAGEAMAEVAARVRRAAHSERAKEVSRLIAQGKDTYLHQGSREDCYTVCASFETRDALSLACRARPPSPCASKKPIRWRSGTTRLAIAMDVIAMVKNIVQADACMESACTALMAAVSGVAGKLFAVGSGAKGSASASSQAATPLELQRALAALEVLCWGSNDCHVRAGMWIQMAQSSGAKTVQALGRVVHVDALAGTVCYYPTEVRARSLQACLYACLLRLAKRNVCTCVHAHDARTS
jgi:hypothetical protein